MNWGLPVDEDIKDFVRDENDCHQCAVEGDVLEQCTEHYVNHDESPVKIDFLTELGWDQENCSLAYYGNATSGSDYEDYQQDYQESSASEMSPNSYDNVSSSAESIDYDTSENYLCGNGLENNRQSVGSVPTNIWPRFGARPARDNSKFGLVTAAN